MISVTEEELIKAGYTESMDGYCNYCEPIYGNATLVYKFAEFWFCDECLAYWRNKIQHNIDLRVMDLTTSEDDISHPILTKRQLQVVLLVCEGLSNSEIAAKLGLAVGTVEGYRDAAYRRLNVHNPLALYKWAIINSLIVPPDPIELTQI